MFDADPFVTLRTVGEKLPPSVRECLLSTGDAGVAKLIEILRDDELAMEDGPGGGWAQIHAVDLLAELNAGPAIEPMLRILARSSWDEIVHDRIVLRLPLLGVAVKEPALALLADADSDTHQSLCCVLAKLGVRDDRIFAALCDLFDDDETMAAICFADYGDARALPILEGAIEDFEPDYDSPVGIFGLADLVDAHERLGGLLPDDLRAHVDALRQQWGAHVKVRAPLTGRANGKKIGRNDPCPCASGKKYKKCCLGKAAS